MPAQPGLLEPVRDAIRAAIDGTPTGAELVVIATYTAMLSLRDALSRLGYVGQFWED